MLRHRCPSSKYPEFTQMLKRSLKRWCLATLIVPPQTSPPKNRNNYVYVARDTYKCEHNSCLQKCLLAKKCSWDVGFRCSWKTSNLSFKV